MHCEREIAPQLYWLGGDDKRLGLFEAHYPVPNGMAYNNYLLLDEKAVLFDTIDRAVEERFFSTLAHLLDGRELDYIIVQHMEPDHSATLGAVASAHPNAKLVCTKVCAGLIGQFFGPELAERTLVVGEGDTLECGTRTLTFAMAPMVHWPEVMVTYDAQDKILFSADAFGSFGALGGRLFDTDYDFEQELLPEMRRYYANIVGKFGPQVNKLLDKADALSIELIAPLHGPLVKGNIAPLCEAYRAWASYTPQVQGVAIAYASVYGGTRDVAETLASKLREAGVAEVSVFDLSADDASYVLGEAFRVSNIVLASVTYNTGLFPKMGELLDCFAAHGLRGRKFSLIQNGSWGPAAAKLMAQAVEALPGSELVGETFTIKSRMTDAQDADLDALAQAIAASLQ